jgi:Ni,Fe-hydrogenase III large subunit
MHPEVRSAEPGSCSICGMDLVPRERAGGTEHVGAGEEERGVHGHEGMGADEAPAGTATEYTCPMHPEVSRDEPGSCPVCGMDLVPREEDAATAGHEAHGHAEMRHGSHEEHGSRGGDGDEDPGEIDHADGSEGQEHHGDAAHGGHEGMDHGGHGGHGGHGHMDHGDMSFMSMVEMTRDLPRSSDGLQMERVEAPFGPLFPGLPGGLSLKLTLDGDTVAGAEAGGVGGRILEDLAGPAETLVDRLSGLDPLSPVAYRLLAIRTVEEAAGIPVSEQTALARAGALERERAASHLNWLAGFAHLLGYAWLEACAARLQMALLRASGAEEAARLRPEVVKLARRVERTPLLGRKLRRLGRVPGEDEALGPVARAGGTPTDARTEEWIYRAVLGFEPVVREGNDALSRLLVRLEEAERSLELVRRAGQVSIPALELDGAYGAGVGAAKVETPRGAATLRVTLEGGAVSNAELETPSTAHLGLVERVVEGEELANALIGVASLDISPWGVTR